MKNPIVLLCLILLLLACGPAETPPPDPPVEPSPAEDGVRMIPIETPKGTFNVWTRKVGENPTIKVLLLHGGPGFCHHYLLSFDDHFPAAGIEYYYYDQLGSQLSDQPDDADLWTIERFVDEVEQVRVALGLDSSNFYLWGNSWGGMLGMEYALAHQQHLKGLIISNMMASIPAYNDYAEKVLMATMDPEVLAELKAFEAAEDYENPRYMELLMEHHYVDHLLRMPAEEWPDFVNTTFEHVNPNVYVLMQGPSELGASGTDRGVGSHGGPGQPSRCPRSSSERAHDTMDPAHMEWMAGQVANGRHLHCPNGSHMAHIDDQEVYFEGLLRFLRDVDAGRFEP